MSNENERAFADGLVHLLDDTVADQIAAGEVVERPASAVKELVENALDAGATRIDVLLRDGGLGLIEVADNGAGMGPLDAQYALHRHATSKIESGADLFHIGTFGFRGEALPSIASVSRLELITKPHGQLGGTRISLEGGEIVSKGSSAAAAGTVIRVRDLFYNTPARLKFLTSKRNEVRLIVRAIQRLAVPWPEVAFRCVQEKRVMVDLPATTSIGARYAQILGHDAAKKVHELPMTTRERVVVTGYASEPEYTRHTSEHIWTWVNRRFVSSRNIQAAIRRGYEGMLDRGRHPMTAIFVELPPQELDVNVHPMKTEVRFHDKDPVFRAVRAAVRDMLAARPWIPNTSPDVGDNQGTEEPHAQRVYRLSPTQPDEQDHKEELKFVAPMELLDTPRLATGSGGRAAGRSAAGYAGTEVHEVVGHWQETYDAATPAHESTAAPGDGFFSRLNFIGVLHETYLIAADEIGLVVIDQHAAHERITFEALRAKWQEQQLPSQAVLVPKILHLDLNGASLVEEHSDLLTKLGYTLGSLGDTDFAIETFPTILARANHEVLLRDILDELSERGGTAAAEKAAHDVLLRMACHKSIRAGDVLREPEARALFNQMDIVPNGGHCPHGRPVWFRMTLGELERRFGRS